MCLYGNDLDEDTTPVEAGLTWVIGKDRKETGNFIGADGVRKHLKEGPPRRRVGMIVEGAPARRTHVLLSLHSMSHIFMLVSNRTRQDFCPCKR
jgi:aminomethyltransferase